MKKVIIFRDFMLSRSETFIQGQAESLREFQPVYAGLRPAIPSLPIQPDVLMTTATGAPAKVAALAYRLTSFAPRFHARLKAQKAALIHAHFAVDGAAILHARHLLSLPLVVTLHGYDITWQDAAFRSTWAGRRYLSQRPQLFADAAKFLCVSKSIQDKAIAKGFPSSKMAVHYTGINCAQFSPLEESARDPNLVLFVGRLVEMKGCEYLLRAMALLKQLPNAPNKHINLVILGDGHLRASLESLARDLGVGATFLGTQPPNVVREWLAKARLFCAPSVTTGRGQAEGLGMVFLEAQAMGTPVVSSLSGGIPEAVEDGQTGLLAAERDVPTLAAHILRLLTDDTLWKHCSVSGRQRVLLHFDIDRQASRLEALYSSVCATS